MHESAGRRRFFRSILTLTLTCTQFLLLHLMLSPHKHHLKRSFLGSWCKRDLEGVQEENFLLVSVHKCSAPSSKEGVVLYQDCKCKVNANIKQFYCLHSCDQIVRLG